MVSLIVGASVPLSADPLRLNPGFGLEAPAACAPAPPATPGEEPWDPEELPGLGASPEAGVSPLGVIGGM